MTARSGEHRLRELTPGNYKKERVMGLKWMLLALLGLGSGAPALADLYSLTIDHCTGGCGAPPFGTIDVTQAGTDTAQVDVSLAAGDQFVRTGFPGSFAFDLAGNPAISVSDLIGGWSLLSTSAGTLHFDGFGYLEYALVCNACGNGGSHPFPGQISFDVTAPGLTPANFQELSSGGSAQVNFVADILGTTGRTGPVGATLSNFSARARDAGFDKPRVGGSDAVSAAQNLPQDSPLPATSLEKLTAGGVFAERR